MAATELRIAAVVVLAGLFACVEEPPPGGADADPSPYAARCELPSAESMKEDEGMLPGRRCMVCHRAGGSATQSTKLRLEPLEEDDDERDDNDDEDAFTAAGTVFSADQRAPCDLGGPSGVTVRLLDEAGTVLQATQTVRRGNFWFEQAIPFPVYVELEHQGRVTRMQTPITSGDCAACHDDANHQRVAVPR